MGKEIERKFKVTDDSYRSLSEYTLYRQGYLTCDQKRVVRIRIAGQKGYITVKGPSKGIVRDEFEYEIPCQDAQDMLDNLCERPIIEKHRYRIVYDGDVWEVDEFLGVNEGLVIAEIELKDENQVFNKPPWLGVEVTGDPKYYNSNLAKYPFTKW